MVDPVSSAYKNEREADAAFFEDWSEWTNLGGWSSYTRYPVGSRPTGMPHFYCILRRHSRFVGGPAFEVAVPRNIVAVRLLKAIAGAREYPRSWVRSIPVEIWMVPAAQRVALRRALPAIKAIVGQVVSR